MSAVLRVFSYMLEFGSLLRLLGPGLVTGAADDDPSGIATYSQAGAQFGFALCWTMLLTLPFMAAIQIISATIGWQTRRGLAHNLAQQLPLPVLYGLVALLAVWPTRSTLQPTSPPWRKRCASSLEGRCSSTP